MTLSVQVYFSVWLSHSITNNFDIPFYSLPLTMDNAILNWWVSCAGTGYEKGENALCGHNIP